jgi:hypothetical protein
MVARIGKYNTHRPKAVKTIRAVDRALTIGGGEGELTFYAADLTGS